MERFIRVVRGVADQHRPPGERARHGPGRAGCAAGRGRGRLQDPRGLRRGPGADRRDAGICRRARRQRRAAHGRAERVGRARRHGRRDQRPNDPRLPRRRRRRRPCARRHRAGPRGEHHLLVDDADASLTASTPSAEHLPMTPSATACRSTIPSQLADDPRADPRHDHGRGRSAPRAGRDRRSRTATRRAWAASARRCAARSSWPTS